MGEHNNGQNMKNHVCVQIRQVGKGRQRSWEVEEEAEG